MPQNLSKNILATVCYYDGLEYPLTFFEIWKHLIALNSQSVSGDQKKCSLPDIIFELENNTELKKQIDEKNGYYFLRGKNNLVEQRIERNKISEKKFKIIRKAVRFLRFVPFVRMIAVSGRIACKNAEEKSDLDLLIIIKDGKIFTGRLLATLVTHIIGRRRHGRKIKNRICLNHFLTDKFFISVKDIFSAHEYSFLVPVFDVNSFMRFQQENEWIKKYKVNFEAFADNNKLIKDSKFSRIVRKVLEKILQAEFVEVALKKWQQNRIKKNPKTKQAGGVILYGDEELSFWPNFEKQGPKVFEKFQEKINGLTR